MTKVNAIVNTVFPDELTTSDVMLSTVVFMENEKLEDAYEQCFQNIEHYMEIMIPYEFSWIVKEIVLGEIMAAAMMNVSALTHLQKLIMER